MGLWEEYQNKLHNEGVDKFIEGYNSWLEEMLTSSNQGFVTEAGDVENWKGGINKELAQKSISETVEIPRIPQKVTIFITNELQFR